MVIKTWASLWMEWSAMVILLLFTSGIVISSLVTLTHWGHVTHICIGNLIISGSDNGLSPGGRQAIIWTNARILLIGHLGTNFSDFFIGIQTLSFKKIRLKMSSAKRRPFCLGLNVLRIYQLSMSAMWRIYPEQGFINFEVCKFITHFRIFCSQIMPILCMFKYIINHFVWMQMLS